MTQLSFSHWVWGAGAGPKSASPRTISVSSSDNNILPSASRTWTRSNLSGVIGSRPSRVTPPLNSSLILILVYYLLLRRESSHRIQQTNFGCCQIFSIFWNHFHMENIQNNNDKIIFTYTVITACTNLTRLSSNLQPMGSRWENSPTMVWVWSIRNDNGIVKCLTFQWKGLIDGGQKDNTRRLIIKIRPWIF